MHPRALKLVSKTYKYVGRPTDKLLMRVTGGRYTLQFRQPMGMLHTTGHKSGKPRSNCVLSIPDGDRFVLIASNFGRKVHPAWYMNLDANPDVQLMFRGKKRPLRARTTEGEERQQLWDSKVLKQMSIFGVYEGTAAPRTIPVVVLEPANNGA